MVPIRIVLLLVGLLVAVSFIMGFAHWRTDTYACFNGKRHYGDWFVVYSIGKLELRARAWGCPSGDRYEPAQYHSLYSVPVIK